MNETTASSEEVPVGLRRWFVVHFVADVSFAIPLMVAPRFFLELFGWTEVDVLSTRIVAAALFGIGIESLLGRNGTRETFRAMLNLKVIWASAVIVGITISMFQGAPMMGWAVLGIFVAFWFLWTYYRLELRS